MAKLDPERTYYSSQVKGDRRNYEREARFDYTDGYLGINQQVDGKVERLLLSPGQVKALIDFYNNPADTAP